MSADANLPAIKAKLRLLVDACLEHAEAHPSFASQLEDILLSDNLKRNTPKKRPRVDVDVVSELGKTGVDGLRARLNALADSELRQIAKADGVLNSIGVKETSRSLVIDTLLAYAERKLNQGSRFLGVSKNDQKTNDIP